jgi:hypothetical protein
MTRDLHTITDGACERIRQLQPRSNVGYFFHRLKKCLGGPFGPPQPNYGDRPIPGEESCLGSCSILIVCPKP